MAGNQSTNDAYSLFLKVLDDRHAETVRGLDVVFAEKQVRRRSLNEIIHYRPRHDSILGRSTSSKATPSVSMVHRQKISYHCQFGEFSEGDGQFTDASGVAVNMITGDIVLADANNHRVQVTCFC